MATKPSLVSELLSCLSNLTWSGQRGRAARSRDREEKSKQTCSGMNEKWEQWDTTDDFAFLYVKNILYHISEYIHSCNTFPAGLAASDPTLCTNACHQTRELPSEISINFLCSSRLSQAQQLLIHLYSMRHSESKVFSKKFIVLLLVTTVLFCCTPKLL